MKHILVPMLGDDRDIVALDAAAKLTRTSGGHIDARLFVRDPRNIVPYVGEGVNAEAIAQIVEEGEKLVKSLTEVSRATFQKCCEDNNIDDKETFEKGHASANFDVIQGALPDSIVPLARLVDGCIFTNSLEAGNPDRDDLMMAAMLETGRPVLLVPSTIPPQVGSRIVVAWNGSIEATRAVMAAMPLMQQAEAVFVLAVDDPEDKFGASGLAATLQMNDIAATAIKAESGKADVSAILASEAKKVSADLIVIGAYSHSRLRETIFGGVTAEIQKYPQIATLLVH